MIVAVHAETGERKVYPDAEALEAARKHRRPGMWRISELYLASDRTKKDTEP